MSAVPSQPSTFVRRRLRAARWLFGIACCMLVLTCAVSMRWHVNVGLSQRQDIAIGVGLGGLTLHRGPQIRFARPGVNVDRVLDDQSLRWLPYYYSHGPYSYAFFPLWILVLVSASAFGCALLLERRSMRGACPLCGYDLTGNVSGRCPECGTPIKER